MSMSQLKLDGLRPDVREKIEPFFDEVLGGAHGADVHSLHIVGSSLTADFHEKESDINAVIVMREMDTGFIRELAGMGKKHGKKRIAAPLLMTPSYIDESRDVFPIEFLGIRLVHRTVYGEDIFEAIELSRADLRLQCEREVKARLIGLRQGYIRLMGDSDAVGQHIVKLALDFVHVMRGMVYLMAVEPPVIKKDVVLVLTKASGVDCSVMGRLLGMRGNKRFTRSETDGLFDDAYAAMESLGKAINEIKVI